MVVVERAHRIGAAKASRQRPVVVKFHRYKDREATLKNARNLKGCPVSVRDDVSERVQTSRRNQMDKLREARENGKIAYFSLDRLVIKDRVPAKPTNDVNAQSLRRPNTRSKSAVD